jgi:hypothetical protein
MVHNLGDQQSTLGDGKPSERNTPAHQDYLTGYQILLPHEARDKCPEKVTGRL